MGVVVLCWRERGRGPNPCLELGNLPIVRTIWVFVCSLLSEALDEGVTNAAARWSPPQAPGQLDK